MSILEGNVEETEESTIEAPEASVDENNADNKEPSQNKVEPIKPHMAQYADDLKGNETLGAFDSITEQSRAHLALLEKLEGAVTIPGEQATSEDWDQFFSKLGRPGQADDYNLTKPEGEGAQLYSEQFGKDFRQKAFSTGLTQGQAQEMHNWFNQQQISAYKELLQSQETAKQESLKALRKDWGGDFEKNLGHMTRAVKQFGGQDSVELLNSTGLSNHPVIVKMFANIGKAIAEDHLIDGNPGGNENLSLAERMYPQQNKR